MKKYLTGKDLITYKKTLVLTDIQRDILIGTLLGDASMSKSKSDRPNIKFEQKLDSSEYIYHLYDIFKDWVGTPPTIRNIEEGKLSSRKSIWFRTYSHSALFYYFNQFYSKESGKKVIPFILKKKLTPRVLAYWYMDDGSFSLGNENYYLHTQCFTNFELKKVQVILKEKFNINTSLHKDRNYLKLYIKRDSNILFASIIRPYILPTFLYKLKKENS